MACLHGDVVFAEVCENRYSANEVKCPISVVTEPERSSTLTALCMPVVSFTLICSCEHAAHLAQIKHF